MAYNTQEERLVVKGSERITRDLQVNQDVYVNGNVVSDGLTANNGVIENGTVNTLGVNSLTGVEATVTDLNVTNLTANTAVVDELTVNVNLIANGLAGNNGQVLGKVDGKVEWFSPATIDTNDFKVNYLTVNNVANIVDANVANLVVDNAIINNGTGNFTNLNVTNLVAENAVINVGTGNFTDFNVANLAVNTSANINGDSFTHKGFDVTSMTVIDENDYNNLGSDYRNQALYITKPNGNMYFYGIQYAPSAIPAKYVAYVKLTSMVLNNKTLTTSTLTFTSGDVTNNRLIFNGIMEVTSVDNKWNNSAQIGTNTIGGNVTTNANELYIVDASNMYTDCSNLIDTFVCNNALITGAPDNYDPMRYCTSMASMFHGCSNFNQPVTIPNGVENMYGTFHGCSNFNQPVTIPNSVKNMYSMFNGCINFNQPVTIPNGVENTAYLFTNCQVFNQPVTIPNGISILDGAFLNCRVLNCPITMPNSVTNLQITFRNCRALNQPIIIPENVVRMNGAFQSCVSLNQPVFIYSINLTGVEDAFKWDDVLNNSDVPFHIRHEIELGATYNYIYNCLVNGKMGLRIPQSRIFNDL